MSLAGSLGCLFAWVGAAAAADHAPPDTGVTGEPLIIELRVNQVAEVAGLRLHLRPIGASRYEDHRLVQIEGERWGFTVPRAEEPGYEYYLDSDPGAVRGWSFASADDPQRVDVVGDSRVMEQRQELADLGGYRSLAELHTEVRRYGERGGVADELWIVGASYTWHSLGTVRSFSLGMERMRGQTWVEGPRGRPQPRADAGLDLGRATVELSNDYGLSLSPTLILGADAVGFTGGAEVAARIGPAEGTHVKVHRGGVRRVGTDGGVGLFWSTIPPVPMGMVVELSSWPVDGPGALLAHIEAHPRLGDQGRLDLEIGYQARRAELGGLRGGLGCAWRW